MNDLVKQPLLNPDHEAENVMTMPTPGWMEVLLDYFSYIPDATVLVHQLSNVLASLANHGHLADLSTAFETNFCDYSIFGNPETCLIFLQESSKVSIGGLLSAADRAEHPELFNELRECLNSLAGKAQNESLFRYLLPGNFATAESLLRDLHPTLLRSKFRIYFSDTFQPKRQLVEAYIGRMRDRDIVVRGYAPLLALAGFSQTRLQGFNNPSEILRAALDQLRGHTVEAVLLAILRDSGTQNQQQQQQQQIFNGRLRRLGHLIAFCLGHPSLESTQPSGMMTASLPGCFANLGFSGSAAVSVSRRFVLRLLCNLLVVDEYVGGQPSVNFARLICVFQRDKREPVRLTEHGVFVAAYCADADMRRRFFGDGPQPLRLFRDRQLADSSVRAVVFFVGPTFASRLLSTGSLERSLLTTCFDCGREVVLVMDEGVWPDAADSLLNHKYNLVNKFILPRQSAAAATSVHESDEIVWRNFLVYLANLPRAPPQLPPQPHQPQQSSLQRTSAPANFV